MQVLYKPLVFLHQLNNIEDILQILTMSDSMQEQSSVYVGDGTFYQVEKILKKNPNGTKYLIRWKDYPDPKDYTWQPLQHLTNVMNLVEEFNAKKDPESLKKVPPKDDHQIKAKAHQIHNSAGPERHLQKKVEEDKEDSKEKRQPKKKMITKKADYFDPQRKPIKQWLLSKRLPEDNRMKEEEQIERYIIPSPKYNAQACENVAQKSFPQPAIQQKWYNQEPYRLASVLRHRMQDDKLRFICNVQHKNGGLAGVIQLGSEELKEVDKEMEKKYLLSVLSDHHKKLQQQNTAEHKQFEDSWKD